MSPEAVELAQTLSIAPNGPITFVSELYTGSISDRGIVIHNGFFLFVFMADKGFTIQDLFPLVTSLNIPPFLEHSE